MLPLLTYKPPQLLAHPTRKQNKTTDYEPQLPQTTATTTLTTVYS